MGLFKRNRPPLTGWRRFRRWVIASAEWIIGGTLLFVAAVFFLLKNLDRPSVSRSIVDYLREELGLEVSYDTLSSTLLQDLEGREIRVANPDPFRTFAPTFLRIGSLSAHWDPQSLLSPVLHIDSVVVHELEVALVMDETGRTSVDLLFPSTPSAVPTPTPVPTPLSHSLETVPNTFFVGEIRIEAVKVTLLEVKDNALLRQTTVKNLEAKARVAPGEDGRLTASLELSSPEGSGLSVELSDHSPSTPLVQTLELPFTLEVGLAGRTLEATLKASLKSQTFTPLPVPEGAGFLLSATTAFLPDAKATEVSVTSSVSLPDAPLKAEATLRLTDREEGSFAPTLESLSVNGHLEGLLPLAGLQDTLSLKKGALSVVGKGLELDPESYLPLEGELQATLDLENLRQTADGSSLALGSFSPELRAHFHGPLTQDITLYAPLHNFTLQAPSLEASLEEGELTMSAGSLTVESDRPETSKGSLEAAMTLRGFQATSPDMRIRDGELSLSAELALKGEEPLEGHAEARLARFALAAGRGKAARLDGSRMTLELREVKLDPEHPEAATGNAVLELALGPVKGKARFNHQGVDTDYAVSLRSSTLGPLGPLLNTFLSPGESVAWKPLSFNVTSRGKIQGLTGSRPLFIAQRATVHASHVRYGAPDMDFRAGLLHTDIDFRGTPEAGVADVDLTLAKWRFDEMSGNAPLKTSVRTSFHLPKDRYVADLKYQVGDFTYIDGSMQVIMKSLTGAQRIAYERGALEGDGQAMIETLEYEDGGDRVEMSQLAPNVELSTQGDLETGILTVDVKASTSRLTQNYSPLYPPVDFRVDTTLRMARLSAIAVDRLEAESEMGKTTLSLTATLDDLEGNLSLLSDPSSGVSGSLTGGESLTVRGVLTQRLEALSGEKDFLIGSGLLELPFSLESPDQMSYRFTSQAKLKRVDITLPADEFEVKDLTGQVHIVEEFRLEGDEVIVLPTSRHNAYARASFGDAQPYLKGEQFFSARQMTVSGVDFAPVAGNLRIDRNVFHLDQLEMGALEGLIRGQMLVDYKEGDTRVLFRGTANGLQLAKSGQDRLDSNLALEFSLDKLDLSGQAHIVKIGRESLLALLDVVDPKREDEDMNRVRLALAVGYPRYVRLKFDHGFMSLKIELGGAVEKIRIDEIRGIAIGPVLNTYLGDLL